MVTWGELMVTEQTIYTINSETEFTIYNVGDTAINPRNMELVITFRGDSTDLSIENTTTDEKWEYTGTTVVSDVLQLDGVRATKNSLSIYRDTNRKIISLANGTNDFIITGTSGSFVLTFEFRFKTL
jgi:type V secretory pathway adhesin AidA